MSAIRHVIRHSLRSVPKKSTEITQSSPSKSLLNLLRSNENCKIVGRSNLCTTACPKLQATKTNGDELTRRQTIGRVDKKMRIMFTCKKCDTRNSKTMTKLAYEKGIVIIRCEGCKNNHLIADNLGWFGINSTKRNIEKILKEKNETVIRRNDYAVGTFEAFENDDHSTPKT